MHESHLVLISTLTHCAPEILVKEEKRRGKQLSKIFLLRADVGGECKMMTCIKTIKINLGA